MSVLKEGEHELFEVSEPYLNTELHMMIRKGCYTTRYPICGCEIMGYVLIPLEVWEAQDGPVMILNQVRKQIALDIISMSCPVCGF